MRILTGIIFASRDQDRRFSPTLQSGSDCTNVYSLNRVKKPGRCPEQNVQSCNVLLLIIVVSCNVIRWKSPEGRDVRGLPKLSFRESSCWRTSDDGSRIPLSVLFTAKAFKCSDSQASSRGSEFSACLIAVQSVFLSVSDGRLLLESVTSGVGNSSPWKTSRSEGRSKMTTKTFLSFETLNQLNQTGYKRSSRYSARRDFCWWSRINATRKQSVVYNVNTINHKPSELGNVRLLQICNALLITNYMTKKKKKCS